MDMKALALVAALAAPAYADDEPFDFLPLQIGLGGAWRSGHDKAAFDGTVRLGIAKPVGEQLMLGGYAQVHTYSFATFEASVGPQLQRRVGEITMLQLRAGIGAHAEGNAFVEGGVQLAHAFIGGNVTARRDIPSGETAVSFNVEINPLMIVVIALLRE